MTNYIRGTGTVNGLVEVSAGSCANKKGLTSAYSGLLGMMVVGMLTMGMGGNATAADTCPAVPQCTAGDATVIVVATPADDATTCVAGETVEVTFTTTFTPTGGSTKYDGGIWFNTTGDHPLASNIDASSDSCTFAALPTDLSIDGDSCGDFSQAEAVAVTLEIPCSESISAVGVWNQNAQGTCDIPVSPGTASKCLAITDVPTGLTVIPAAPLLALDKAAPDTATYAAVGDTITYTYTVTNVGNVTITDTITVTDDKIGLITCSTADIAPLELVTCTATYTVTQADIDTGSVMNTATASAGDVTSPEAMETVPAEQNRSLSLDKSSTPEAFTAVGNQIDYTFKVTNTGNTTLDGPVTVSDSTFTVTCPAVTTLAPGASVECTLSYTITQADMDNGAITNTATATADGVTSNEDTYIVETQQLPALSVVKENTAHTDADASGTVTAGDALTFTITATNTGNITLNGVVVNDPLVGGSETCATLAPDATCVLTVTYTVTAADAAAGLVKNTATADSDETDPSQDTEEVDVVASPGPGPGPTPGNSATDIPIFGPLGLLAMLFSLLLFGRNRKG